MPLPTRRSDAWIAGGLLLSAAVLALVGPAAPGAVLGSTPEAAGILAAKVAPAPTATAGERTATATATAAAGPTASATPVPVSHPDPLSGPPTGDKLQDAIRDCESSNDYHALNLESTATGAYQFLDSTWADIPREITGGTPRARDASIGQQDAAFVWEHAHFGIAPWTSSQHCWGPRVGMDPDSPTPTPKSPSPAPSASHSATASPGRPSPSSSASTKSSSPSPSCSPRSASPTPTPTPTPTPSPGRPSPTPSPSPAPCA